MSDETAKDNVGSPQLNRATLQRYHSGPKLGKQPGHTISKWLYGIEDLPAATVMAQGYFNAVADELGKGDIIEVVGSFNSTPEFAIFIVTKVQDGAVTVAPMKK